MHEMLIKNTIDRCRAIQSEGDCQTTKSPGEETTRAALVEVAKMLDEANGLLRSFGAVCERKGEATNWEALTMQVKRILDAQHRLMHPEQYLVGTPISELSGRPGDVGFAKFDEIAASWGY